MVTGIEDCLCTLACGRVVPCGARQVWPDLPDGVVETQRIDVIPEPPARARRNRKHRRAPMWAPEAVGHVTRRGRGEVGRLRGRER